MDKFSGSAASDFSLPFRKSMNCKPDPRRKQKKTINVACTLQVYKKGFVSMVLVSVFMQLTLKNTSTNLFSYVLPLPTGIMPCSDTSYIKHPNEQTTSFLLFIPVLAKKCLLVWNDYGDRGLREQQQKLKISQSVLTSMWVRASNHKTVHICYHSIKGQNSLV